MLNKINILGQEYEIVVQKEYENEKLKNNDGICEVYEKKIVLCDFKVDPIKTINCPDLYKKKVLRHEIIHAFLFESGLRAGSDWACDEEVVDYFAMQLPKIVKAIQEAEAM